MISHVPSAQFEGLDFVKHQLKGFLPRESKAILRRATAKIAATVRNDIRRQAPRKSGTLRKAIKSRRRRGSRNTIEAAVFITHGRDAKHDAFYWRFLEHGTKDHSATPFIGPAFEPVRADYQGIFKAQVGRQIEKQLEKRAKRQAR